MPSPIALNPADLTHAICAIVELAIEPPRPDFTGAAIRPLHQVTLRPDKISRAGYLRLGETPGDEALCWIRPEHIAVHEILGRAYPQSADERSPWRVEPAQPATLEKAA